MTLLEQQNERSLKAITLRVAAQSNVESMKANATALKVNSLDRAMVSSSSLDCSPIPTLGACDTRPIVDYEAKAKPMVRKMSIVDKHRRASRKNPRLRALSFCSEIGDFAFADIAPITKELIRQGHIKDMLMRKLNKGNGAFSGLSTPLAGAAAPPEAPSKGAASISEKVNGSADNAGRKSISLISARNNSVTSLCSRGSYVSVVGDGSLRNLFRGTNSRKERGKRSMDNCDVSMSDATDYSDDSNSDDDEGETYCASPSLSRPGSPPSHMPMSNANCAISQAMAESHEQLADILFRKSQALLMLSDSEGDNEQEDEEEGVCKGPSKGLKEALHDALRVRLLS